MRSMDLYSFQQFYKLQSRNLFGRVGVVYVAKELWDYAISTQDDDSFIA